ncbi:hypothetical protein CO683_35260 [Bradyrhizobium ottawaense]|uniref:hypothetical protein n=1 Tax=Bradyrhizobium ottawaense TaxID=931866 RepID=UPI000BE86F41|nr:hypothetical protein [Bradyrhizobium ottawaense]PDT64903.1 hypothetical protein CO683_35260 [Bradyrhizobium ottawaense]
MSSIFVLPQRSAVHMMTDGVVYDRNGVITIASLTKAAALPSLPAAVACTGPAFLTSSLAPRIDVEFASFDDFVERADSWLPETFTELAERHRNGDAFSTFYIIGWLEKQKRPAAYSMNLWTDRSSRIEQVLANSGGPPDRSRLIEQTTISGTPLNPDLIERCGFRLRRKEDYVPELDLLHITEVARQEQIEGAHWVGGKILLTSVDATGITQRVVHQYSNDRAGAAIRPEPVEDWAAWRRELRGGRKWWR